MATQPPMTPLQQAVASNNASALARMEDKILPELWELNRWLLASLLAINSAAAAAVYSAQSLKPDLKTAACWFFIYGALAALGSGFALTFVLRIMQGPVGNAQHYWNAVSGGHPRSEAEERTHIATVKSATRWSSVPQIFLFASVVFFLIGIAKLPAA